MGTSLRLLNCVLLLWSSGPDGNHLGVAVAPERVGEEVGELRAAEGDVLLLRLRQRRVLAQHLSGFF